MANVDGNTVFAVCTSGWRSNEDVVIGRPNAASSTSTSRDSRSVNSTPVATRPVWVTSIDVSGWIGRQCRNCVPPSASKNVPLGESSWVKLGVSVKPAASSPVISSGAGSPIGDGGEVRPGPAICHIGSP